MVTNGPFRAAQKARIDFYRCGITIDSARHSISQLTGVGAIARGLHYSLEPFGKTGN